MALLFLKCILSLSLSLSLSLAVASEPSMYSCCVNHVTTFFSRLLTCSCWTQKPQKAHFLASLIRNTILPRPPLEYHEYSEGLDGTTVVMMLPYVTMKESVSI